MKLLVLPGDGIGPEITAAAVRVLSALDARFGLGLDLLHREIGLRALEAAGTTLPEPVMELAEAVDGILLGPVDTAAYPPPERGGINPSAAMRKGLDLYANIRPSRVRAGTRARVEAMDLVIVRENTEGFYPDRNMAVGAGEFMPTPDLALAVRKITRAGAARIGRAAAQLASRRRKRLTMVTKSNVLKLSDGLFREAVTDAAAEIGGLTVEEVHVDAMAALLVRTPAAFDVVVTTNMFGDILSNEAAELSGGLGLAASLNAGDGRAVAQAAHGTAPDIAGRDIANPSALILSVAMLLDRLGETSGRQALRAAAAAAETALDASLADPGGRTRDLGGGMTTSGFAAAIADRIARGN